MIMRRTELRIKRGALQRPRTGLGQERPNTNQSLGLRRSTETNGREVPGTDLV